MLHQKDRVILGGSVGFLSYPKAKPPGDPQAAGNLLKNNGKGNGSEVIVTPRDVPDSVWMMKLVLWVRGNHGVTGSRPSFCLWAGPLPPAAFMADRGYTAFKICRDEDPPVPASDVYWSGGGYLTRWWRRRLGLGCQNVTRLPILPASGQNPCGLRDFCKATYCTIPLQAEKWK